MNSAIYEYIFAALLPFKLVASVIIKVKASLNFLVQLRMDTSSLHWALLLI